MEICNLAIEIIALVIFTGLFLTMLFTKNSLEDANNGLRGVYFGPPPEVGESDDENQPGSP